MDICMYVIIKNSIADMFVFITEAKSPYLIRRYLNYLVTRAAKL